MERGPHREIIDRNSIKLSQFARQTLGWTPGRVQKEKDTLITDEILRAITEIHKTASGEEQGFTVAVYLRLDGAQSRRKSALLPPLRRSSGPPRLHLLPAPTQTSQFFTSSADDGGFPSAAAGDTQQLLLLPLEASRGNRHRCTRVHPRLVLSKGNTRCFHWLEKAEARSALWWQ